ncbi:MAG: GntR family transcriptional regulator [Pseudomonadota bacterium]
MAMTAAPNATAQRPKSQSQRAVEELRSLILRNELQAGGVYLETELAEMLDMSRTPVREAALVLEAQGLVQVRPRKGVRILPVAINDMREIYDILTELESLAAFDAASKNYSEEQLGTLSETIEHMDLAVAADNREAWARADDLFHEELLRLGGNERVVHVAAMMADQVHRAKRATLFIRPSPSKSNEDHRGVLEAIRDGDGERARAIHHQHRQSARDMLIALLEKHHLLQL